MKQKRNEMILIVFAVVFLVLFSLLIFYSVWQATVHVEDECRHLGFTSASYETAQRPALCINSTIAVPMTWSGNHLVPIVAGGG
jgi:hypothetical protein